MATESPALLLPLEAFEVISTYLTLAELCAVESTCKSWRQLGLLAAPAPVAVDATPLKGTLDNEEKIDSFGFWLFKRGSKLQKLRYEQFDCQRHNAIAFNVFNNVSTTLTSLHLVISKHTKNRRGLPGPATFTWLPVFPNLHSIYLEFQWSVSEDWELTRWAPNLKELAVEIPSSLQSGMISDLTRAHAYIGHAERNPLPKSVEAFKAFGCAGALREVLRYPWAKQLTSLSMQYPTKRKSEKENSRQVRPVSVTTGLLEFIETLKGLEEFSYDMTVTDKRRYPLQFHVMDALTRMENLKTLRSAFFNSYGELTIRTDDQVKCMKSLSNLETLHILGNLRGWQDAAMQGAFSQVTELAVVAGNSGGEAYLPKGPCLLNLEHLIVDFSVIKTAFHLAEGSSQSEEKNKNKSSVACEFAAHLKIFKKVTVLTTGFASFYSIWNIDNIATWVRNVMKQCGYPIAVDIEGEEYVFKLKSYLASDGVVVGEADREIAGSAAVWKKWEYDLQMEAMAKYSGFPDDDDDYY